MKLQQQNCVFTLHGDQNLPLHFYYLLHLTINNMLSVTYIIKM